MTNEDYKDFIARKRTEFISKYGLQPIMSGKSHEQNNYAEDCRTKFIVQYEKNEFRNQIK